MKKKKPKLELMYEAEDMYGTEARTLCPTCIGDNDSGWTIEGEIHEDYYEWVNNFKAVHAKYGMVSGDYETQVFSTSKEGYKHFNQHHPYEKWDYMDI